MIQPISSEFPGWQLMVSTVSLVLESRSVAVSRIIFEVESDDGLFEVPDFPWIKVTRMIFFRLLKIANQKVLAMSSVGDYHCDQ